MEVTLPIRSRPLSPGADKPREAAGSPPADRPTATSVVRSVCPEHVGPLSPGRNPGLQGARPAPSGKPGAGCQFHGRAFRERWLVGREIKKLFVSHVDTRLFRWGGW